MKTLSPHWLFEDVKLEKEEKLEVKAPPFVKTRRLGEQQWEIISFVYNPSSRRWVAVSTALCPTGLVPSGWRFETLVSGVAKKFPYDVERMEALGFMPEEGETVNVHFHPHTAVLDHFDAVIKALEEDFLKPDLLKRIGRK